MGVGQSIKKAELQVIQTPIHRIRNYLNTPEFSTFSIAEIDRVAPYEWSESHEKRYFYYVLEGQGEFLLNDQALSLGAGDIFVVPPHSKYRTPVGVRMLAIVSPRFE